MGDSTFSCCAYCWKHEESWASLLSYKCNGCGKHVHFHCIKSPQPSPLLGDAFFNFKCDACGEENKEEFHRMSVSWQNVVMLALYNLHKTGHGRCGFFHWRAHICAFIDKHWFTLFGLLRKKTGLWMGTVAGTLSSGCPPIFESGTSVVEQGYWKLSNCQPPLPALEKKTNKSQRKRQPHVKLEETTLTERRCRRTKASPLSAAIELKEKRWTMTENQRKRKHLQTQEASATNADNVPSNLSQTAAAIAGNSPSSSSQPATAKSQRKDSPPPNADISSSLATLPVSPQSTDTEKSATDNQSSLSLRLSSSDSSSTSCVSVSTTHLEEEPVGKEESICVQSGNTGEDKKEQTGISTWCGSISVGLEPEDSDNDDLDIDIDSMVGFPSEMTFSGPVSPSMEDIFGADSNSQHPLVAGKWPLEAKSGDIKLEPLSDCESEGQSEKEIDEGDEDEDDDKSDDDDDKDDEKDDDNEQDGKNDSKDGLLRSRHKKRPGRPRKRRRSDDEQPPSPPPRLKQISVFEETELLQKLNWTASQKSLTPDLAQLRRKLLCNQTNREFGLPVFNLDAEIEKTTSESSPAQDVVSQEQYSFVSQMSTKPAHWRETRDLDRFMISKNKKKFESHTYKTFHQRLVGMEEKELKPIVSPYTTRVLLPFIWKNHSVARPPLKMRLLQEIQAYPHRKDPSWLPPPPPSIDYCYVRPEHIPSVNALCREFFWPGIDMSECLQYPDFTCVVLYRKIVIAFAFMVPDRGYNEAYVSFIFTHPEWRGAGIASFMLYHLIQTCMGKDVLLHVSASNPAMLLYQKFGFKVQELILHFYYKYFPLACPDSTHAFLMRLTR